jgi:LPXTG-motif cell wall-anchored protein
MVPNKDKHQFYIDVVPKFGFPLAMMARFQLNLAIFRMEDVPELKNMEKEVVLPFLWAGLGFKDPSELMANQISVGLKAPSKYPLLMAVVLFALGGALLLTTLGYFLWRRRNADTVTVSYNERP